MSPRPPNFDDARKRGLIAVEGQGIHTFSNGTQYECWAAGKIIDPTQLTFLAPDRWPTVDAPVEVHA